MDRKPKVHVFGIAYTSIHLLTANCDMLNVTVRSFIIIVNEAQKCWPVVLIVESAFHFFEEKNSVFFIAFTSDGTSDGRFINPESVMREEYPFSDCASVKGAQPVTANAE